MEASALEDGDEAAEKPKQVIEIAKIGGFENDKFMLRKGDHSKIFTHFKCLYVHRVQFVGLDEEHR